MKNSNDKSQSKPSIDDPLPFDSLEFGSDQVDGPPLKGISPARPPQNPSLGKTAVTASSNQGHPPAARRSSHRSSSEAETPSASEIRQQRREALRRGKQAVREKSSTGGDLGGAMLLLFTVGLVFGL